MAYKKTNWQDTLRDTQGNVIQKGTPLNAQALGKIEEGIVQAEQKIDTEIQQVTTQLAQSATEVVYTKKDLKFSKKQTTSPLLDLSKGLNENTVTVTTDTTNHLAFPAIYWFASKYFMVYRKGSAHGSFDGAIVYKTSTDAYTWSAETVLFSGTGKDYRDPSFVVFNGKLVMKYFVRILGGINQTYITATTDLIAWSTPVAVPSPSGVSNASRGDMLVRNGSLYMINYTTTTEVNSTFLVSTIDLVNFSTPLFFKERSNEASIAYSTTENKFIAVLRQQKEEWEENDYSQPLVWGESVDGITWIFKELAIYGHCPSIRLMSRASTGTAPGSYYIVTYRDTSEYSSVGRFTFNMALFNANGEIVSKTYNLEEQLGYDMGYGDVLIMSTDVVMAYYVVTGSTSNIKVKVFKRESIAKYSSSIKPTNAYRYLNADKSIAKGIVEKVIFGDMTVKGDGTNKKDFTIDLTPLGISSPFTIRTPTVIAVHTTGVFFVTVRSFTELAINCTIRDINGGIFSSDIPIKWSAYQVTYSEPERS